MDIYCFCFCCEVCLNKKYRVSYDCERICKDVNYQWALFNKVKYEKYKISGIEDKKKDGHNFLHWKNSLLLPVIIISKSSFRNIGSISERIYIIFKSFMVSDRIIYLKTANEYNPLAETV